MLSYNMIMSNDDMSENLHTGSFAPDFTLCDQNGTEQTLSNYRGQWVFICFYGSDGVAKCVKEIDVLIHHFEIFKKLGITLFGISADSIENHKQFAEKHGVPFALLSDESKKVAKKYEVMANERLSVKYEDIPQVSFLVNVGGEIEKIYAHIKPEQHASEVIADFMKMQREDQEQGPNDL